MGSWLELKFAASFSFLNMLPLLGALGRSIPWPDGYQTNIADALAGFEKGTGSLDGLMILSGLQQFIGIILLFFLLLGLRNRFRLK